MVALILFPLILRSQVQLDWLPDAPQPKPHVRLARRTKRAVDKKKLTVAKLNKDRIAITQSVISQFVALLAQVPVQPKGNTSSTKKITKTDQTVTLSFQNTISQPAANLKVALDFLDLNKSVVKTTEVTTDSGGTVQFKVAKFPTMVQCRLEDDGWAIVTPNLSVVALKGSEGDVVASLERDGSRALRFKKAAGGTTPAQSNQTKTVVIHRAFKAPIISVEPTTVQILATSIPDTEVWIGDQMIGKTATDGNLSVRLPAETYPNNGVLLFHHEGKGATLEATQPLPLANLYSPINVSAPSLKLISINELAIPGLNVDINGPIFGRSILAAYGKPVVVAFDPRSHQVPDFSPEEGTVWWSYPTKGLAFRVRNIHVEGQRELQPVVERIRITGNSGGEVAGIAAGEPSSQVESTLGRSDPSFSMKEGTTMSYLEDGITFKADAEKVAWIELRRPIGLIHSGIDTSPVDALTKIYVAPIQGNWQAFPDAAEILSEKLKSITGIELTNDPNDADLHLDLQLGDFKLDTGKTIGIFPDRITDALTLRYRLYEAGESVPEWKTVDGKSEADYRKEVQNGALLFTALEGLTAVVRDPKIRLAIQLAIGISAEEAAENTRKAITKAKSRVGPLALSQALKPIVDDITHGSDVRIRVTEIDRKLEQITLNAGSAQGVTAGTWFSLYNASNPGFHFQVSGYEEHQILAKVTSVSDESCICDLVRVDHFIDGKAREENLETVLKRNMPGDRQDSSALGLLDPTTGLVWAQRVLRVP